MPQQVVLSGDLQSIENAKQHFDSVGIETKRLPDTKSISLFDDEGCLVFPGQRRSNRSKSTRQSDPSLVVSQENTKPSPIK